MKSESGPLKYRLARKWFAPSNPHGFELVLQGWFEWRIEGKLITPTDSSEAYYETPGTVGGEWRTLKTVDLED